MSPARQRARDRREGDERESKPRRKTDRRAKLLERISAGIAVLCFAAGWWSLQHQADNITAGRIDSTKQRCDLVVHIVRALDQARTPKSYAPELRHDLVVCNATLAKYRKGRR